MRHLNICFFVLTMVKKYFNEKLFLQEKKLTHVRQVRPPRGAHGRTSLREDERRKAGNATVVSRARETDQTSPESTVAHIGHAIIFLT